MLWNHAGIPQKGWVCIGMVDLGEDLEDMDADSRRDYYETCQMCNHEGIRYVHIMRHDNYQEDLRVGQQCAEKMENDYVNPKERETKLRNRQNRWKNFMKKDWHKNGRGNYVLKYKGWTITIMSSQFAGGGFGVYFGRQSHWKDEDGKKIMTFEKAKLVAFKLLDGSN
jgi:hypothetical protein